MQTLLTLRRKESCLIPKQRVQRWLGDLQRWLGDYSLQCQSG